MTNSVHTYIHTYIDLTEVDQLFIEKKERKIVFFFFFAFCFFSTPFKIVPRTLLLALAYVVLPRIKEKKRKNIYMLCVEFCMASWRSLDRFLTPLDFSRRLLACSWLISFVQESARLLRNHQEANKKTSRSCWDAAKKHQDMSRKVLKISKKILGPSRSIKNTKEVLRSDQEVFKKWSRSLHKVIKND